MDKKVLTFNARKPQELALSTIDNCIQEIREGDFSSDLLKKLCCVVSYNSLFMIDSYNLVNGKQYSIENVCYNVRGLLKIGMHEMLESISDIVLPNACFEECLRRILGELLVGELFTEMKINAKNLYCAFLLYYLHLMEMFMHKTKLLEMWDNPAITVDIVWNYYMREVLHAL